MAEVNFVVADQPCLFPRPGPGYWEWRCLSCSHPIADHLSWRERRRERRHCNHFEQRCIHGDEINHCGGYRAICKRCHTYLVALPVMCSTTGEPHDGKLAPYCPFCGARVAEWGHDDGCPWPGRANG